MCMSMSHSHGCGINWVVLFVYFVMSLEFGVHQVEHRVTHLLLVDANDGIGHGEHLHHVRRDPDIQLDLD